MKVMETELVVDKRERESTSRDRWHAGGPTNVCQKKPGTRTDFAGKTGSTAAGQVTAVLDAEAPDSTRTVCLRRMPLSLLG